MPILGTIASSTRQGQSVDLGAMFPLQVITVSGSGASSVSFTNIPNTYSHLQIRAYIKTTINSNSDGNGYYRVGNESVDTGSNYDVHALQGNGTTASSGSLINSSYLTYGFAPGTNSNNTNTFAPYIIDILDYANTNKFKTIRHLEGYDLNGVEGSVWLRSGLWRSTSAINTITFSNTTYAQYSQFALYGIKGA
jgi:hypothetical protein